MGPNKGEGEGKEEQEKKKGVKKTNGTDSIIVSLRFLSDSVGTLMISEESVGHHRHGYRWYKGLSVK